MKTLVTVLVVTLILCSFAKPSFADSGVDRKLTKQISDVLTECKKITPGMKRGDLLKVFTTEGGLSSATHRTFVHRRCPYIKLDVEFALSEQKQKVIEERPMDTIIKISKPYLDRSIID
jgi:hypothetical protein